MRNCWGSLLKRCGLASNTVPAHGLNSPFEAEAASVQEAKMKYKGSCHCRAVTFEVEAPGVIEANYCNCSICTKSGFLHLIVPANKFRLLSGSDQLTTYTFNTGVAKHTFCQVCGIKPFYTPRSNPDGVDVNVHCLDPVPEKVCIENFDGQNWEQNAHELAHKSRET